MKTKSRVELYEDFIREIQDHASRQRTSANRRMISVALWCILAPIAVAVTVAILVQAGALPQGARGYLDWMILIFPVAYSITFLGTEAKRDLPILLRKGGTAGVLKNAVTEAKWREEVSDLLERGVSATSSDWNWIYLNYKMELQSMRYRNRYLTVLAGAVFFLIMEGIDVLEPTAVQTAVIPQTFFLFLNSALDQLTRLIAMGFVLVLLYLSGSQLQSQLEKYLNSLELLIERRKS